MQTFPQFFPHPPSQRRRKTGRVTGRISSPFPPLLPSPWPSSHSSGSRSFLPLPVSSHFSFIVSSACLLVLSSQHMNVTCPSYKRAFSLPHIPCHCSFLSIRGCSHSYWKELYSLHSFPPSPPPTPLPMVFHFCLYRFTKIFSSDPCEPAWDTVRPGFKGLSLHCQIFTLPPPLPVSCRASM